MRIGNLDVVPMGERLDLVGKPVAEALAKQALPEGVFVAEIDPKLADTAAFCAHYNISLGQSANCVIVEATRGERTWYAACVVLATTRADINGLVRRTLDARRASFASMDIALAKTAMEYGGITPIGLPTGWPILIDAAVAHSEHVVIGSGIRGSKIIISGRTLASVPGAVVLENMGKAVHQQ